VSEVLSPARPTCMKKKRILRKLNLRA